MEKTYPVIDVNKTGQNIKRLMLTNGFIVKDIQAFLGLKTPQSIYHWFDGRCLPTIDNLYALSELFCVPVDSFLCGSRKVVFVQKQEVRLTRMLFYYGSFQKLKAV